MEERKCPIEGCIKTFRKQCGYNMHITRIHKLAKISRQFCNVCKLSWITSNEGLQQHIRTCEARSEKKAAKRSVKCRVCGKTCRNTKALSVHLKFHNPEELNLTQTTVKKRKLENKTYFCEYCGKGFANSTYLKNHVLIHKPEENPKIYICDYCGKVFTLRRKFTKHLRTVHLSIPSPCTICRKVYRNKTLLNAHMLYHTEARRIHYCVHCPDKPPWWTAVALRRHQESNHGLGPGYYCPQCGVGFRTNKSLLRHLSEVHEKRR